MGGKIHKINLGIWLVVGLVLLRRGGGGNLTFLLKKKEDVNKQTKYEGCIKVLSMLHL